MTGATRRPHPDLPGLMVSPGEQIADVDEEWPVVATTTPYASAFISVREETVTAPDGAELRRTTVVHPGAVGVVALDDDDRVLMLEQYRHPVRQRLFEIPAGLLDVEGESAIDAAARELAEESDLVARDWEPLATVYSSPGFTNERLQLFAARDLSAVAESDRTVREAEEADMTAVWVPLADAVAAVLDGRISNELTAVGLLAVHARKSLPRPI